MSETKLQCPDCDVVINEDDGCAWSELTEKAYCYDCEQSDLENASTLLKVHGDPEAEKVIFGDSFSRGEYGETPDWFHTLFDDWKGRVWEKTSAWRGHYDTEKNFKGIAVLASGWTTGWADEYHQRKALFNNFGEEICDNTHGSVGEIFFLTEPTSNVFSSSMVVFCREDKKDAITNWLSEIGYPVEKLQEWLS